MKKNKLIDIVLENNNGKVLRYARWSAPQLHLVKQTKSDRLQFLPNLSDYDNDNGHFHFHRIVDIDSLKKNRECIIDGQVYLRLASENEKENISVSPVFNEPDEKNYQKTLKYSAVAHAVIFILFLSAFWIHNLFFKAEEIPLVKIELPKNIEIKKPIKKMMVAPSKKKLPKKMPKRVKVAKAKSRIKKAKVKVKSKVIVKSSRTPKIRKNVATQGALGALGGFNAGSKGFSGQSLNLKSAVKAAGRGHDIGSNSTLGRTSALVAGKGLVKGGGYGQNKGYQSIGYGTKGISGGKAGYGKTNIGGSGSQYELPLQGGGDVIGGLEMSQIEAVIKRNLGQIFYCYEKGLQSQPDLQGRVLTKFVINGSGRVAVANVGHSSLNYTKVERCMISKIRGWKFPKPVGQVDVKVSYPFTLKRAKFG